MRHFLWVWLLCQASSWASVKHRTCWARWSKHLSHLCWGLAVGAVICLHPVQMGGSFSPCRGIMGSSFPKHAVCFTLVNSSGGWRGPLSVGQSKLALDCPNSGLRRKERHNGCQYWSVIWGSLSDEVPHRSCTQGLFIATLENKQCSKSWLPASFRPLQTHMCTTDLMLTWNKLHVSSFRNSLIFPIFFSTNFSCLCTFRTHGFWWNYESRWQTTAYTSPVGCEMRRLSTKRSSSIKWPWCRAVGASLRCIIKRNL